MNLKNIEVKYAEHEKPAVMYESVLFKFCYDLSDLREKERKHKYTKYSLYAQHQVR